MNTKDIQAAVCRLQLQKNNFVAENVKNFFVGEADVCALTLYGYSTEFEIKISRSDFKADFKKSKWKYYTNALKGVLDKYALVPNYFYYVCPADLIKESELQPYQGLIYIVEGEAIIIKTAKRIHSVKHDYIKLLQKMFVVSSWNHYFGGQRLTMQIKAAAEAYEQKDFTPIFSKLNQRNKHCFKPCPPGVACECMYGHNANI